MEIFIDKNDVYVYRDNLNIEQKIYGSLYGKFEKGDRVKIVNNGWSYTTYRYMADAMNIPKERWNFGNVNNGDIGVVINRKIHANENDILYAVSFNGIHIFGEKGLELVSRYITIEKLEDEDFEL